MMHLLKSFALLAATLILIGCSEETTGPDKGPPPPPDCIFPTLPQLTAPVVPLTTKAQANLPFHSEKLEPLLLLPLTDGICYIEHQGPIAFHKMTSKIKHTIDIAPFELFPEATAELMTSWGTLEDELSLPLAGMTAVTYFEENGHESMIRADILLSTNSSAWHMWHEFSHYLMAQARNEKLVIQTFAAPKPADLTANLEEFKIQVENKLSEPELLESLKKVFALHDFYDSRVHLEEVVIELNLLNMTTQEKSALVTEHDIRESAYVINLFYGKHSAFYQNLFSTLDQLLVDQPEVLKWYEQKKQEWTEVEIDLAQHIQEATR